MYGLRTCEKVQGGAARRDEESSQEEEEDEELPAREEDEEGEEDVLEDDPESTQGARNTYQGELHGALTKSDGPQERGERHDKERSKEHRCSVRRGALTQLQKRSAREEEEDQGERHDKDSVRCSSSETEREWGRREHCCRLRGSRGLSSGGLRGERSAYGVGGVTGAHGRDRAEESSRGTGR